MFVSVSVRLLHSECICFFQIAFVRFRMCFFFFQNAFEGPLARFGQLLFLQLVHGHTEKERISQHHFVKSGKEVLRLNEESLKKYYFALFSGSKDHLTKAGEF